MVAFRWRCTDEKQALLASPLDGGDSGIDLADNGSEVGGGLIPEGF